MGSEATEDLFYLTAPATLARLEKNAQWHRSQLAKSEICAVAHVDVGARIQQVALADEFEEMPVGEAVGSPAVRSDEDFVQKLLDAVAGLSRVAAGDLILVITRKLSRPFQ